MCRSGGYSFWGLSLVCKWSRVECSRHCAERLVGPILKISLQSRPIMFVITSGRREQISCGGGGWRYKYDNMIILYGMVISGELSRDVSAAVLFASTRIAIRGYHRALSLRSSVLSGGPGGDSRRHLAVGCWLRLSAQSAPEAALNILEACRNRPIGDGPLVASDICTTSHTTNC